MSTKPKQTNLAILRLYNDGWTRGLQLAIGNESVEGSRIFGPKFTGHSKLIKSYTLTARDAVAIRFYLDRAFPVKLAAERKDAP